MEIDANKSAGSVNGYTPASRAAAASPSAVNSADSFTGSNALDATSQNTPDVRADAVARGRALVAKDGYPPADTIKKLSQFLAAKLQGNSD